MRQSTYQWMISMRDKWVELRLHPWYTFFDIDVTCSGAGDLLFFSMITKNAILILVRFSNARVPSAIAATACALFPFVN